MLGFGFLILRGWCSVVFPDFSSWLFWYLLVFLMLCWLVGLVLRGLGVWLAVDFPGCFGWLDLI